MTDSELIQHYLQGNIHSFNLLVGRWEKPVFNFILKTVSNEDLAKDICQIVFVKVYQQLKRLNDPDCFPSWVYRIAYRACCDEFKKSKRHKTVSLDEFVDGRGEIASDATERPDQQVDTQQIQSLLKDALNTLPEEQRTVIIMKQYQGLKFHEIADILDEPINTVKSRLYYGLKAMRKMLEASEFSKEVLLYDV